MVTKDRVLGGELWAVFIGENSETAETATLKSFELDNDGAHRCQRRVSIAGIEGLVSFLGEDFDRGGDDG